MDLTFFDNNEDALYDCNKTFEGLYPIGNKGLWHSGIHVKLSQKKNVIKLPYTSVCIDNNIYNDKADKNYVILKNTRNLTYDKNGDVTWYTIIKGFNTKKFEDFNNQTIKEIVSDSYFTELINNVPFYFNLECSFSSTAGIDSNFYKNYLYGFDDLYYDTNFNPIVASKFDFVDLKSLKNKYYIKKNTKLYSSNKKEIGTLADNIQDIEILPEKLDGQYFTKIKLQSDKINFGKNKRIKIEGFYQIHEGDVVNQNTIDISNSKLNRNEIEFYEFKNEYSLSSENNIKSDFQKEKYIVFIPGTPEAKAICNSNTRLATIKTVKENLLKGDAVIYTRNNFKYLPTYKSDFNNEAYQLIANGYERRTTIVCETWSEAFDTILLCLALKKPSEITNFITGNNMDLPRHCVTEGEEKEVYTKYEKLLKIRKYKITDLYKENGGISDLFTIDKVKNPINSQFYEWYYVNTDVNTEIAVNIEKQYCYAVKRGIKKGDSNYFVEKYIFNTSDFNNDFKIPNEEYRYICSSNENLIISNISEALKMYSDKKEIIPLLITRKGKNENGCIYLLRKTFENLQVKLDKRDANNLKNISLEKGAILGITENDYFDFVTFTEENLENKNIKINQYFLSNGKKVECLKKAKLVENSDELLCLLPSTKLAAKSEKQEDGHYLIDKFSNTVYVYKKTDNNEDNIYYDSQTKSYSIKRGVTKEIWFVKGQKIDLTKIKKVQDAETLQEKALSNTINLILDQIENKALKLNNSKSGEYIYKFEFSVGNKYINNEDFKKIGLTDGIKYLKIYSYEKCEPDIPGYKKVIPPFSGVLKIFDSDEKQSDVYETIKGVKYRKYINNNELYYINVNNIEKKEKDIGSEIVKNFIFLNYGKNKKFDTEILYDNQIYLKVNESDTSRFGTIKKIINKVTDSTICKEATELIYSDSKKTGDINEYLKLFKKTLKKITCKHPLEFDQSFVDAANDQYIFGKIPYNDDNDNVYKKLFDSKTLANNKNEFYFYCPPYFLNTIFKYENMFINPYLINGKFYKDRPRLDKRDPEYEVKENIGFATAVPSNLASFDDKGNPKFSSDLKAEINGKEYYFARINCPYGYSYSYNNKSQDHKGIDLPGYLEIEGKINYAPVISLIRGRIWACTTQKGTIATGKDNGYGRMMVIKGDNDKLYILGHLSSYACHEEGQYVQPGDIVAYAGNTGNSQGAHLHLEVIECKLGMGDEDWRIVMNINFNKKLIIDGGEDDNKSRLRFFDGEGAYYVSGTSYGHGNWTDNRLNPLTGRKK